MNKEIKNLIGAPWMKGLLLLLCLTGSSWSCNAQKPSLNSPIKSKNMQITTISNDFEHLDLTDLKARANKTRGVKVLPDNRSVEVEIYDYQTSTDNGQLRISGDNAGDFRSEERLKDSYFSVIKTYYPNGNIKTKGLEFNVPYGSFKKGTWYNFSSEGKLAGSIDYDSPFKYDFEQLVQFLQQENIPLKKGPVALNPGFLTSIRRTAPTAANPVWEVSWLKASDKIEVIEISGLNGKVMSRKTKDYINN